MKVIKVSDEWIKQTEEIIKDLESQKNHLQNVQDNRQLEIDSLDRTINLARLIIDSQEEVTHEL